MANTQSGNGRDNGMSWLQIKKDNYRITIENEIYTTKVNLGRNHDYHDYSFIQ